MKPIFSRGPSLQIRLILAVLVALGVIIADPMYLEVVDESYRHNVPAGSESHFKVVLVSDRFTGERFLNRHRMIYGTLTEELSNTVHALALHTYTIKEWEALQDTVFASPPCRGAGSIA